MTLQTGFDWQRTQCVHDTSIQNSLLLTCRHFSNKKRKETSFILIHISKWYLPLSRYELCLPVWHKVSSPSFGYWYCQWWQDLLLPLQLQLLKTDKIQGTLSMTFAIASKQDSVVLATERIIIINMPQQGFMTTSDKPWPVGLWVIPCQINHLKYHLTPILMKFSTVVGSCENTNNKIYHWRYRSLNFDPNGILITTLMPITLLLTKLEKHSIYH